MKIQILLLLFITSCAFAPINGPKMARSLGKGNMALEGGLQTTPYLSYTLGVAEDLDLNFSAESQIGYVFALSGKYSFINNPEGWSLGGFGGVGYGLSVIRSKSIFVGPIVSWKKNWFETFFSTRFNYVDFDDTHLTSSQSDSMVGSLYIPGFSLYYFQSDLGFNFYPDPSVGINLGGRLLWAFSDGEMDGALLPYLGLSFFW